MRSNNHLRFSLKTKVTLFSLVIFAISIWGLAFYASQMLREDMLRQLGEQQSSTTAYVAAEINDEIDERVRALELIAGAITPAMLNNPALAQKFLDQRVVLKVYFNGGFFALSKEGIAITDTPISTGRVGVNFMDRKYAIGALKEGKVTIGNPVEGKVLKSQVFGIAVPIRDAQGRVIAALVGSTDLAKPNFLDKITQNNYGRTGGYLLVAPEIRTVVTATDKRRIMQPLPATGVNPAIDRYINGREGADVLVNPLGEEVLTSVKGIPVAGWYVVTSLPTAEAFSPIHNMQSNILFATILFTILAGCLIWLMLRRQLVPVLDTIKLLSGHSQNASEQQQPLPVYRQDEIGDLVGSFNRLLSGLNQRELDWKREAEKNLALLRNSSDGIHILDNAGNIIEVSDSFCTMLGYTREELIGMNVAHWDAFIPASDLAPAIAKQIESNTRSQFETRHRPKDGSIFDVEISGIPFLLNGRQLLYNSSRDITERKRAADALHLNEERLRLALSAANQGWFDLNVQTGEVSVSPEYIKMIGYEVEGFHTNLEEWISNLHY